MGRKSTFNKFLGKTLGGIQLIESVGVKKGRLWVKCLCKSCGKEFEAQFHNIYKGNYKSCGCLQHASGNKNPKWKGEGEISKSYFESLKRGASSRNLSFKITIQDIWDLFLKQNRKCIFSGVDLIFPVNRKDVKANASLDRINSNIGYELNNIQWVDKEINYMKQSMNSQQFLDKIQKIYKYNYE